MKRMGPFQRRGFTPPIVTHRQAALQEVLAYISGASIYVSCQFMDK